MKVCLVQPKYTTNLSLAEEYFAWELAALDRCDDSMDLIVFPESCDVPALTDTAEEFHATFEKFHEPLVKKVRETAKRCRAIICFNAISKCESGIRNTTYVVDRCGNIAGKYYKQHLTECEVFERNMDSGYTFDYSAPTILELEGLKFAFLTCYDFYFYEAFANIARMKPDLIIGCSHQRSDTHRALELMTCFAAYNCNAYVLRSSVSMDENSEIGGCAMVAAPNGDVLLNMGSKVGMATVDIDPKKKYLKPMGFGGAKGSHADYIEVGRRPYKYRPAGSAIVRDDRMMPYPRICAHRGFNTIAPENSLPAYGAAVAMGADEIEFDLWNTKDGEVVSIHDARLDRVSNGTGRISDYTYAELLQFDFGSKVGEKFKGMKIPTFEDILRKFACHAVMNIHLKTATTTEAYDEGQLRKIIALIEKYDCKKYVYFMTGNLVLLQQLKDLAPDITRCCGAGDEPYQIVENAIRYGCRKVQLFKPCFNREMIEKAHANGIICNVFWSDDGEEAKKFLDMGVDTILTNDYWLIASEVRNYLKEKK